MVEGLFDILVDVIEGFGQAIVSVFQAVIEIFYDSTAATPGFTTIGILLLVGFGISLVFFALRYIARLIRMRGN